MRRDVVGAIVGIALSLALAAVMVQVRSHLSLTTPALILMLPVVAGVVVGGFSAGIASVISGFLVYDFFFVPPYNTLTVGHSQNWVALAVYALVMLLVARIVSLLGSARAEAQQRAVEARRVNELSELLVEDHSVVELLETIVRAVRTLFDVAGVALLLPSGDHLELAASAGEPISGDELHRLDHRSGIPVGVGTGPGSRDQMRTVALSAAGRPVGILALRGVPPSDVDRALLRTFANHAALTLERAQLREQALRSELLEEVDRLRDAFIGAVSHDLRTPLATIKVASSTLLDPATTLSDGERDELCGLIDVQTDRLTRLVTSLLDMTRFRAGVVHLRHGPCSLPALVREVAAGWLPSGDGRAVGLELDDGLPQVDIDADLIGQVLANLLDNAHRHGPPGTALTVAARQRATEVVLSVADQGPGVPADERESVFERFVRFDTGGRAGLGLAIAKTFVEAHGERIWVEDVPGGGARFAFTLPTVAGGVPVGAAVAGAPGDVAGARGDTAFSGDTASCRDTSSCRDTAPCERSGPSGYDGTTRHEAER